MYSPMYVPSIWDYIAQGGSQAIGSFQQAKSQAQDEAEKKRAETMQGLQMLMQMESQGLTPYTQVNSQMQEAAKALPWLQGAQMTGPSAGGLQAQIANTPDKNVVMPTVSAGGFGAAPVKFRGRDQFSDTQLSRAGLPTRTEEEAGRKRNLKADVDLRSAIASESRAASDQVFEETTRPLALLTKLEPVIASSAERHISAAINAAGGRLSDKQLSRIADAGYAQFLASKEGQMLMKTAPEQNVLVKSAFDKAVRDAYMVQQEMDLRKSIAAIQAGGRQGNQTASIANALSNAAGKLETQAKNMSNELSTITKTALSLNDPKLLDKISPSERAKAQQINEIRQAAANFQRANAGLLSGSVTPEQATQLLSDYLSTGLGTPATGSTPSASPVTPVPGGIGAMGGKRKITADQREYLKATGQWNPNLYEVAK